MKKAFPNGKIIWIDAHIDANTPDTSPSRNAHGMPLSYLSGLVPLYRHWQCVKMEQDLCYFGIRSYEPEEKELIDSKQVLVFQSSECDPLRMDSIEEQIHNYFKHKPNQSKYWISFDIDGVDSSEFMSTGTDEGNGLKMDFVYNLMERMVPQTVGMDLTEVNFSLTEGEVRQKDEETFRNLFTYICEQVNKPTPDQTQLKLQQVESIQRLSKF
jgi:arginase